MQAFDYAQADNSIKSPHHHIKKITTSTTQQIVLI